MRALLVASALALLPCIAEADGFSEKPYEFCAKQPSVCWDKNSYLFPGIRFMADIRVQAADGGGVSWATISEELSTHPHVGIQLGIIGGTLLFELGLLPPFSFTPANDANWLLAKGVSKVPVKYGLSFGFSYRGILEIGVGTLLFDSDAFEHDRDRGNRPGMNYWFIGVQPLNLARQALGG